MLAAFLYLGAGAGMIILSALRRQRHEQPLRREDLRYTVAMVALDIAAPILLMLGLKFTPAANASLLNNFEIVATAVIAFTMFHEAIGRRLWWSRKTASRSLSAPCWYWGRPFVGDLKITAPAR